MNLIKRQDIIDATNSEMVDTNPYHFKSNEKFIEFMDDSDIASFGKWQWANGFNTALVAVRIQLEKLPYSVIGWDEVMKDIQDWQDDFNTHVRLLAITDEEKEETMMYGEDVVNIIGNHRVELKGEES